MQRGKFLFAISILIVLLLIVFWWSILLIDLLEVDSVSEVMPVSDTAKAKSAVLKDTIKSTPLLESFAYIGIVKMEKQNDVKKQTGKNSVSTGKQRASGKNKIKEGAIPELSIRPGERQDLQAIANHLGFVLAASTEEKILGKIVDNTFTPIGKTDLTKFSTRARTADGLDRYDEVRDRVARQFGIPSYDVKLMFLVPLRIEKQWVSTQQRILSQIDVSSDQVTVMRGFYDSNFDVRIEEVVTKDGRIINIQ